MVDQFRGTTHKFTYLTHLFCFRQFCLIFVWFRPIFFFCSLRLLCFILFLSPSLSLNLIFPSYLSVSSFAFHTKKMNSNHYRNSYVYKLRSYSFNRLLVTSDDREKNRKTERKIGRIHLHWWLAAKTGAFVSKHFNLWITTNMPILYGREIVPRLVHILFQCQRSGQQHVLNDTKSAKYLLKKCNFFDQIHSHSN